MYTRGEIIRRFELSNSVFERWYTEFYNYFSEAARPETLGRRNFTDEDIKLIEFIKQHAGEPYDSIRTRLKDGQRIQSANDLTMPAGKIHFRQK